MNENRAWDWIAGGVILFGGALSAAGWFSHPLFLDGWHHLAIIEGFRQAGGPVTAAFWQSAPEGSPHLYPPLFHLLWLPVRLACADPVTVARLWSVAAFPALLAAAWRALRPAAGPRIAALAMIGLATPFPFFLGVVTYPPATLALLLSLGIFAALDRDRPVAGCLLSGLLFWTHAAFSWLVLFGLLLFGAAEKTRRRTAWLIAAAGPLLAAPWLLHIARHAPAQIRGELPFIELSPVALALGIWGGWLAWKRGGSARFLVALAIGFLPLAAVYPFRFFSAQGMFSVLLLAGFALDRVCAALKKPWAVGLVLGAFLVLSPGVRWAPLGPASTLPGLRALPADTTLATLRRPQEAARRPNAVSLYHDAWSRQLADAVRAATRPDDLLYANRGYLAEMLFALTGRASVNEFAWTADRPRRQRLDQAKLLVWLKDVSSPSEAEQLVEKSWIVPAGETQIAWLFKNPRGASAGPAPEAAVPWWLAFGIALGCFGIAGWDLLRKRPSPSLPPA